MRRFLVIIPLAVKHSKYLYSIVIAFMFISRNGLKYVGGCPQLLCKHCTVRVLNSTVDFAVHAGAGTSPPLEYPRPIVEVSSGPVVHCETPAGAVPDVSFGVGRGGAGE